MKNTAQIMEDIELIEKGLKASENLRQQALTKKGVYEAQLKETDEELEKLGTTAEKGKKEIEEIDLKIQRNLDAIKEMIPFELLEKWNVLG